ncbi:phage baseplate assembly protein V [Achromobacter sp. UMC71]|uniref:phage baseplate assembly protein V n=1 Tax=Achromobacter sp. UMC71 TaxID=1862320 RepID=UPI001C81FB4E|nr:phage baseplate assembly protein V [Achromobacter sp. UMC71]MBB1625180.1 baseplate assembly protein [Achromobacter sp. UMC71]
MENVAEALRLIANLIRTGTVFAVDLTADTPCVRVRDGAWESGWMQWIELRAGTTKTWNPPTPGEQVIAFCLGGDTAAGYALAGLNSRSNPAPSTSPNEHVTVYPDGARIVYDHAAGALNATGIKTARLTVTEMTEWTCPLTVFKGKVVIEDLLTYQGGMAGTNGRGNNTSIEGDFRHKNGELSSNGVILDLHKHRTEGLNAPTSEPLK